MKKNGFTLVEIIITIGILAILFSLPTLFLWGIGRADSLESIEREVVSIIGEAQTYTISGRSLDGSEPSSYGVHFEQGYYVYFKGTSYNATDPDNLQTDLPPGIILSQISLPSNNIVFEQVTGEVAGFDPNANFVTVADANTGNQVSITVSKYGGVDYE